MPKFRSSHNPNILIYFQVSIYVSFISYLDAYLISQCIYTYLSNIFPPPSRNLVTAQLFNCELALAYNFVQCVWKCDMPDREGIASNPSEMDEYCRRSGFVSWFETSAKENHGIDNAARALIDEATPFSFRFSRSFMLLSLCHRMLMLLNMANFLLGF